MIKSDGEIVAFFARPIAAGLGVVTVLVWIATIFWFARGRHRIVPA